MSTLLSDIRHAVRQLCKSPGFTLTAIVILALGIGVNISIFSLADSLWLQQLPVPEPDRMVHIYTTDKTHRGESARGPSSVPDCQDLQAQARSFSGIAWVNRRGAMFNDGDRTSLATTNVLSNNFFEVVQIRPAVGRTFTAAESGAAGVRVVLLSYTFWRRQFNADPSLAGRTINIDGQQVAVLGILPQGFRYEQGGPTADLWLPESTWEQLVGDRERLSSRGHRDFDLIARLAPGASLHQANAELDTLAASLAQVYPLTNAGRRITAAPHSDGSYLSRALVALAIPGLVLLIACANVANLLIARAEQRRHEMATRIALGASRLQLMRQLLIETAVLAITATAAALLLAELVLRVLPSLLPQLYASLADTRLNGHGFVFALLAAGASMLLFGLLPAWQASNLAPVSVLKQLGGKAGRRRVLGRRALVSAQIALSLALVVSAGLLVASFTRALTSDPGFNAHQEMLVLDLGPRFNAPPDLPLVNLVAETRRRLESMPGVSGTSIGLRIPFGGSGSGRRRNVLLPGGPVDVGRTGIPIHFTAIGDRYFELLGTRLLRGRTITAQDIAAKTRVMVINQLTAQRLWPNQDPLGRSIWLDKLDSKPYQVIGVVENGIYERFGEEPRPYLFAPMGPDDFGELTLLVKSSVAAHAAAPMVREVLRGFPDLTLFDLVSMREYMHSAASEQRMAAMLVTSLGALGLLMAAVGLYGLLAFLVQRRTREIGIRIALGAQKRAILSLVAGEVAVMLVVGITVGIGATLAATRLLTSLLFATAPLDPTAFAASVLILAAVVCLAALAPALRAMGVDPMIALRCE